MAKGSVWECRDDAARVPRAVFEMRYRAASQLLQVLQRTFRMSLGKWNGRGKKARKSDYGVQVAGDGSKRDF